jgi:hypothetical protein
VISLELELINYGRNETRKCRVKGRDNKGNDGRRRESPGKDKIRKTISRHPQN